MILKTVFHAESVKYQKMSVGGLVVAQRCEFEESTQITCDIDQEVQGLRLE